MSWQLCSISLFSNFPSKNSKEYLTLWRILILKLFGHSSCDRSYVGHSASSLCITGARPFGFTCRAFQVFNQLASLPFGLIDFVYWEVLQLLPGHEQPITSTGRFSRNSWATDVQFCVLGSSPGTPGSRTTNHVYWEVFQELLGHERTILSTGKFSRNSWVTDNQSSLLGSSPGTPGSRIIMVNFVY
ncbi:hypothetical protein V8G54_012781 [Vigna mungo]|uniref:Uncharacterized protein n=1 Tax=Vigna mungo TaxID=3915 RepID=A0AAQ3NSV9_VIGMU